MTISPLSLKRAHHHPIVFEEFFELGQEEIVSPFIKPESRHWGANLTIKSSLFAALLLIASFALSFSPSTLPISHILLIMVYFLAGIPSLIESIEDLLRFDINIDILMTLAAFSSVLIGSSMEGALLLVLFSISGAMEDAVTSKAKSSISSLHKLAPTRACVIESDGTVIERAIADVSVGTHILIKSGQIVPLDGKVIDGASSVNLVHLTGENFPITKVIGDIVPAGARNLEGFLTLIVTHTSADSTLAKIIRLVTEAQESRPALQRWFDKLSKGYAISIICLAALFSITLPFIFSMPFLGVGGSLYRSLAFLIAASPCALIIAIPIAYLSAISACASQGILLKGGIILDALAACSVIAFDKTGTLTTGDLTLKGIDSLDKNYGTDSDISQALAVAYAMEKNAVHPIAKAILSYCQKQKTPTMPVRDFKAVPGYGLSATVVGSGGNMAAYIGNPEFIINNISKDQAVLLRKRIETFKEAGELIAILALGDKIFLFRFQDTLRPHIRELMEELQKKHHMRLLMLTGDHAGNAKQIAKEVGLTEYLAELRPEDKLEAVSKIAKKDGLAMVGDGVNDAPALARATVGICMGKVGSTAAIDAAEVILLHDNIERLGWLIGKSHQTVAIVKQNLILATAAIIVASIPALAGVVPIWLAVLMHEGGTVLVGLNGLRLLWK